MAELADLHAFDVAGADLTVWVFKQHTRDHQLVFNGRWVATSDNLDGAIKNAVAARLHDMTEVIEYDILAQNNEGSALILDENETHFPIIAELAENQTPARKASTLKHVENINFYAIRLTTEMGTLHAVRKATTPGNLRKREVSSVPCFRIMS